MRVVIAEDEAVLREGLVLLLESAGTEVVGVISDAPSLVPMVSSRAPDLVISDIRMPPGDTDDGLRAALEVRRTHPEIAIMILSQYVHRQYALELLGDNPAGVGYLLKQRVANADAFCRDVRRVVRRETVLDTQVVSAMRARARRDHSGLDELTPRQTEVPSLVAEGRSNAAIARRLVISEKAVVQHVSRIYIQLGLAPIEDDHRRVLPVARYLAR
jgi:DNA-binding NarL/FixJ family response regulator